MPVKYYVLKALRVEVYGVLLSTGTNSIFSLPYHWNPTSVARKWKGILWFALLKMLYKIS